MNLEELQREAAHVDLLAYKDPQVKGRILIVRSDWDLEALAAEVARPGGMRVSPHFIGTVDKAETYLMGYTQCVIERARPAEKKVQAVRDLCTKLEATEGIGRMVACAIADQFRRELGEGNLQRTALDVFMNVPRAFGSTPVCMTCGKEEGECACQTS